MRGIIRLGDPTSHGGRVVAVSTQSGAMDKGIACEGDRCVCPIKDHSDCFIAEGDPNVILNGKRVAFEGHKTSCGARLISTLGTSGIE